MNIRFLNPARHLVGRLFLWFWLTALATAGLAVWVSKLTEDNIEITPVSPRYSQLLAQLVNRLEREAGPSSEPSIELQRRLSRLSRKLPLRLIAVGTQTGNVIRADKSMLPRGAEKHLHSVIRHTSPIVIKQHNFALIGPQAFIYQRQPYALFLTQREPPAKPRNLLVGLIVIGVVVSMLLSYWFARTLVKPIQQLRQASKKLANGDWQARAWEPSKRADELGALARDFNEMAAQLETSWRGQKRLLGDISHELRSPLTRLQMALGLAHQQHVSAPTLARIEREANNMEALISQLLSITRAEAAPAKMVTVTVEALLGQLGQDAQFEAEASGKSLEYSKLPSQEVAADGPLLCSAVENVLRNAIRYAHSCIWMRIEMQPDYWQIVIEDDGQGLSEAQYEQIFTPFYRASLARDRDSGGAGLGLAIAKAAVIAHRGTITAGSSLRGGLKVILYFPLTDQVDN
ncbi:HAMP domain-containing protein [Salinimonas marina]|uniref:histidine kinase n=1 Tax=Salinimonas marina TaxID=2785918 RepID=A0A7S9HCS1_9ALTE|nr:ATP-binding protein [Salinimonas marina]QPG05404.1 HAMP domain-containing protein [Salinimonas marina]